MFLNKQCSGRKVTGCKLQGYAYHVPPAKGEVASRPRVLTAPDSFGGDIVDPLNYGCGSPMASARSRTSCGRLVHESGGLQLTPGML